MSDENSTYKEVSEEVTVWPVKDPQRGDPPRAVAELSLPSYTDTLSEMQPVRGNGKQLELVSP